MRELFLLRLVGSPKCRIGSFKAGLGDGNEIVSVAAQP
jgi:hypothetical protein